MANSHHPFRSDQALVTQALNDEMNAFRDIINLTEKLTADICYKMVSNPEDRKDIAQDIYLKVWKNLRGFRFRSQLTTWVAQIAYNTCLNYLRKNKILLVGELVEADDENLIEHNSELSFGLPVGEAELSIFKSETTKIIATAVDSLPPLYKTVIYLFHHHDVSYEDIAAITTLPIGTVKSHLYRARKLLKEYLLKHYKKEEL